MLLATAESLTPYPVSTVRGKRNSLSYPAAEAAATGSIRRQAIVHHIVQCMLVV